MNAFKTPQIAHPKRCGAVLVIAGLALLQACSPREPAASTAAPVAAPAAGGKSPITIVRESSPEFPDRAIAGYRELQQRCFDGRAVVAKAQGWAYDPKADAISDAGILALDTQTTEEYFDGQKYAIIVTGTRFDSQRLGVTQELSCKLVSTPFKSVDIRDGDCDRTSVEYDLPEPSGRRIETRGLCDKPSAAVVDQSGETATVANHACKWNKANPANPVHMATCTLSPNPIHEGTGMELVAIRKAPENLRAAQPLPGAEVLSMQSLVMVEQATTISIGSSIPAAKFQPPADSKGFAVTEVK